MRKGDKRARLSFIKETKKKGKADKALPVTSFVYTAGYFHLLEKWNLMPRIYA